MYTVTFVGEMGYYEFERFNTPETWQMFIELAESVGYKVIARSGNNVDMRL